MMVLDDSQREILQDELNAIEDDTLAVYNAIGAENALITLAEECSELSQAALKYVRCMHGQTPKSKEQCLASIVEETADVALMLDLIMGCFFDGKDQNTHFETYAYKFERMKVRFGIGKDRV